MKYLFILIPLALSACKSDNKDNQRTQVDTEMLACSINEYSINLDDKEVCVLSESQATRYELQEGVLTCDNGYFTLNGAQYKSGRIFGQSFFGLTINCAGLLEQQ